MIGKDTLKFIEDSVKQILEPLGFDLIELKTIKSSSGLILRFLIDRLEGGITLDECTQLNNQIGQFLDEKNAIPERYILEVSSPGLDRNLVSPKDFRHVLEKNIHVFLKEEQNGRLEIDGKLIRLDEEGIFVMDNQGKEIFILFGNINKARQAIL